MKFNKYIDILKRCMITNYLIPIDATNKIDYSKNWYEESYDVARVKTNLTEFMEDFAKAGYKRRFLDVINQLGLPKDKNFKWLKVACNKATTAFWASELFNKTEFYMFDFNKMVIDWVNKYNPIPERTHIWVGDIQKIQYNDNRFDNFFDIISCIDVTEHLPYEVYLNGIKEMFRVLKPGGYLILMQGRAILPEHINIRPEALLILEFLRIGFTLVKKLPHRHYLIGKDLKSLKKFFKFSLFKIKFRLYIFKFISRILQETFLFSYLFFKKIKLEPVSLFIYNLTL